MSAARRARRLFAPALALALACGAPPPTAEARLDGPEATPQHGLALEAKCNPTRPQIPGEAQAVAEAAAAAFPGAAVTVRAARGTVAELSGLAALLRCPPLGASDGPVLDFLAAHPQVFRLRSAEWEWAGAPRCDQVPEGGAWYRLDRRHAAGQPVSNQSLAVRLAGHRGGLALTALHAHYLPADEALEAALEACKPAEDARLLAAVRSAAYPYQVFDRCLWQGAEVYAPRADDAAQLEGQGAWRFDETSAGVTLALLRGGVLAIAPQNVTPKLLASDANCGRGNVGFRATLDALAGKLVETAPGVGCVVCLGGTP